MNGFLFDRRFPGATTCLVIGPVDARAGPADFRTARALLWCGDPSAPSAAPLPRSGAALETVALEHADATFGATLEAFLRRDLRHLPSLFVSERIAGPRADAYLRVVAEAKDILERHHRARETRQKDGFAWQSHLLQNLPAYARHRVPAGWGGALRGVPAFVCAAGPSLDVSAPFLAPHRDRGLIFAADSALRGLARHGIAADFVVSIDAAKDPAKCLAADLPPTHVVLASVSPPAWTSALPAARPYFLSDRQLTLDWLATHGVSRTPLAAGPNCGHTALELAHFLGCAPLFLFGLDLAVSAENPAQRHHRDADASIYTSSGFDAAAAFPTVPGNYTDRVPTFAPDDWRALDDLISRWPADLVFNVNDRGARFRHTTLLAPSAWSPPPAAIDRAARLGRLAPPAPVDAAARSGLATLSRVGARALAHGPALRAAVRAGRPAAVVPLFRQILADPEVGRAFGAFSLKIMPRLLPPTSADPAFWSAVVDEFLHLAALAGAAALDAPPPDADPGG